jgi:hypothetical protein
MVGRYPQAALRLHAVMKIKPFGLSVQLMGNFSYLFLYNALEVINDALNEHAVIRMKEHKSCIIVTEDVIKTLWINQKSMKLR